MIKSCAALLHPAWDMNHPFVQCIHAVYIPLLFSHLVINSVSDKLLQYLSVYIQVTLILLNIGPKAQE